MEIHGPTKIQGATVESFGDHRIAMAFAIAGLFGKGEMIVRDTNCVATSYPGFEKALEFLGGKTVGVSSRGKRKQAGSLAGKP